MLDTPTGPLLFLDTETRSPVDLRKHGARRHIEAGQVTIVSFAHGDGPVQSWAIRGRERLDWRDAPDLLQRCWAEAAAGRLHIVAWNAGFDRLATQLGIDGTPPLPVSAWLDAMAQATCSHLPGDLKGASEMLRGPTKLGTGVGLIRMFTTQGLWPDEAPDHWEQFIRYAEMDVEAMRSVWQGTMPLDMKDWADYWLSEKINDRGLPVDVEYAHRCAALADQIREGADTEIAVITGGAVQKVSAIPSLRRWLAERLADDELALNLLRADSDGGQDENEDEDADTTADLSLNRSNLSDLHDFLTSSGAHPDVARVVQLRMLCGGTATTKFRKAADMAPGDERLYGQYVWRGAAATGRFSSRGIQLHNLPRKAVGPAAVEQAIISAILNQTPEAATKTMRELGVDPAEAMPRLIRPMILAERDKLLVWADWSAIEARALPWLAGADNILDVFRASDTDPSLPDIYEVEAAAALGCDPRDVTKEQRQIYGKVPILSLGYGGGVGALGNMARNYGVTLSRDLQVWLVSSWRAANPWATMFWDQLMWAFENAMAHPGRLFRAGRAGRVGYHYIPDFSGGTVFCELPSGRPLLYPDVRPRRIKRRMRDGTTVEEIRLTARRGRGWTPIWHGLLAENVTQAVCADVLTGALHRIEERWPGLVVGHTHDEIVGEAPTEDADDALRTIVAAMEETPPWAEGLPLKAEGTKNDYYTKAGD